MVGKKKRVVKKRPVAKAKSSVRSKFSANTQKVIFSRFKLGIVSRNLVMFVLLALISYILYLVSESDVFTNLFYFLWVIFGFISVAFLIALLFLLFLRLFRR
jgi:hypothetical protein